MAAVSTALAAGALVGSAHGEIHHEGKSGIAYSNTCGVLPPPREIDYSDTFPGATFGLNLCWQVTHADAVTLKMYWPIGDSGGPWWALH
jgi:hypothetical protein